MTSPGTTSRAGALLATIALAAGCGSTTARNASGTDPLRVINAAYQKTTAATSKVDVVTQLNASSGGSSQAFSVHAAGNFDYSRHRGELTTTLPTGGTTTVLQIGDVIYLKLPVLPGAPGPAHKPWIRIVPRDLPKASTSNGSLSSGLRDPSQALSYLRSVSSRVDTVGAETIRGTKTTHYKVTVDLHKLAASQPAMSQSADLLIKALHTSSLPVDVWVDAQGRVRQLRLQQPLPNTAGIGVSTGTVTMTEQFYDFGTPVTVAVPPASQVTDLGALQHLLPHPSGSPAAA